ncbi:MAG: DUF2510 domain-containing protein [Acidimicrobiia bacterium]
MQPPAWHPDPLGRYALRWWDGNQWTQNVSTGGDSLVDPIPVSQAAPQASVPSYFAAAQPKYESGPTRANRTGATLALCAGIAAVVGSTMEWASLSSNFSSGLSASVAGTANGKDGNITLVLGLVLIAIAIWQFVSRANMAAKVLAIILGALISLVGLIDFADIQGKDVGYVQLSAGPGLYTVIVAGLIGILAGCLLKSKAPLFETPTAVGAYAPVPAQADAPTPTWGTTLPNATGFGERDRPFGG